VLATVTGAAGQAVLAGVKATQWSAPVTCVLVTCSGGATFPGQTLLAGEVKVQYAAGEAAWARGVPAAIISGSASNAANDKVFVMANILLHLRRRGHCGSQIVPPAHPPDMKAPQPCCSAHIRKPPFRFPEQRSRVREMTHHLSGERTAHKAGDRITILHRSARA
jgi:hypothetical protein